MMYLGPVLAGLALLTFSAAAPPNGTFAYVAKGDKLVPIIEPPSSELREWHDPPFGNTTEMGPQNGPIGECHSGYEYDYTVETTALFWGIDTTKRNIYESVSRTTVCTYRICELVATDTVTKTASWKVAGDVNFDINAVKVKIGGEYSAQTTTTRSISYKVQIPEGKSGYLGFGQFWVEAKGNRRVTPVTCCRFGRCTRGKPTNNPYTAYLPRSLPNGIESDGIYNVCVGKHSNQKCGTTGIADISNCKAQGTLISGQTLKGCTDNWCADSSRILISTNHANKVAIHTSGDMCVYGTRKGQYSNTWCAGVSLDPSKGPFYGTLEEDGNFCLYTKSGAMYWSTRTRSEKNGQYRAIIQNDGNFVIYTADENPIWNSGTAFGNIPFPHCGKGTDGSAKCEGGTPGKGNKKGGEGTCCETEADCKHCCNAGVCRAACLHGRSLASH